jgi:hypothetical protein
VTNATKAHAQAWIGQQGAGGNGKCSPFLCSPTYYSSLLRVHQINSLDMKQAIEEAIRVRGDAREFLIICDGDITPFNLSSWSAPLHGRYTSRFRSE